MNISGEYLRRLQSMEYNNSEARFLYLVATHSGHFTAHQFLAFTGRQKSCPADPDRIIAKIHCVANKSRRALSSASGASLTLGTAFA